MPRKCYRRALALDPAPAGYLMNEILAHWAVLLTQTGRYEQAEAHYRTILTSEEFTSGGKSSSNVTQSRPALNRETIASIAGSVHRRLSGKSLVDKLHRLGEPNDDEPFWRRARFSGGLPMRHHPHKAVIFNDYANLRLMAGDPSEAARFYRLAIEELTELMKSDHPAILLVHRNMAVLRELQKS